VAVAELRQKYTIPILGMEPALKVAIDFGLKGTIIVMATGMTLKSRMMDNLIARFGRGHEIVKLPCRDVITLVESGTIDGSKMEVCLGSYFAEFNPDSIASVVFGCTHYGFLEKPLKKVLGEHIHIADGNEGTIRHLKQILKERDLLIEGEIAVSEAEIYNSGGPEYVANARKMLSQHLVNLKAGGA
jgi:glutamate racemase